MVIFTVLVLLFKSRETTPARVNEAANQWMHYTRLDHLVENISESGA
jgi:hypothetical protein